VPAPAPDEKLVATRTRMAFAPPSAPLMALTCSVQEVPVPPEIAPLPEAREILTADMATRKSPAWIVPPLPPPVVVRAVFSVTDGAPPLVTPLERLPTKVMAI
jgi:hypothetical protein